MATSIKTLIASKSATKAPKFTETYQFAQVDYKAIKAEAYAIAVEENDSVDSFIAEMDMNKDGLSKEHKAQAEIIEKLTEQGIALREAELDGEIELATAFTSEATELFSTEWTSDNGKTTIRTKYFMTKTHGIIVKELKSTPTRETFTCAQPTLAGLRGYRAELSNNSELEDRMDELTLIHNSHALLINDLNVDDVQILADLAVIDENDSRRSVVDTVPTIWINYYDGLITSLKNENANVVKAQKSQKRRDF